MTSMQPVDATLPRRLRAAAAKLEAARKERDALIREARAEGMTLRAIAAEVGLTHPGVQKILERD